MKKLIPVLFSSLTLAACGGGSSGGSVNSGGSGGGGSSSPNVLTLTAVESSACSDTAPSTNARLVIHNDDFSERTVLSPNATGEFSYETNSSNITVSLITYREVEMGVFQTDVNTMIDVPATDIGSFETYHESGCSCVADTVTITANNSVNDFDSAFISMGGMSYSRSANSFSRDQISIPVEVCSDNLTITGTAHLAGQDLGISPQPFVSGMTVDATVSSSTVSVSVEPTANAYVNSFIDGYRAYQSDISNSGGAVVVIDEPSVDYHALTSVLYNYQSYAGFSDAFSLNVRVNYEENVPATNDLSMTDVDFDAMYNAAVGDSDNYNFSNVSFADSFRITTSVGIRYYKDTLVWTLKMPVSGRFPNVDNWDFSEYVDASGALLGTPNVIGFDVALSGYKNITSYEELYTEHFDRRFYSNTYNEYELATLIMESNDVSIFESPILATSINDQLIRQSESLPESSTPTQKSENELIEAVAKASKWR